MNEIKIVECDVQRVRRVSAIESRNHIGHRGVAIIVFGEVKRVLSDSCLKLECKQRRIRLESSVQNVDDVIARTGDVVLPKID